MHRTMELLGSPIFSTIQLQPTELHVVFVVVILIIIIIIRQEVSIQHFSESRELEGTARYAGLLLKCQKVGTPKKSLLFKKSENFDNFFFFPKKINKNAIPLFLPIEEISLRPDLSSQPHFRIQGGVHCVSRTDGGGR